MEDQEIIIKTLTVIEKVKVSEMSERESKIYWAGYHRGGYDKFHGRIASVLLVIVIFIYWLIKVL